MESEGGKNKDKKIVRVVMMKLIIMKKTQQKTPGTGSTKSLAFW
jgi:hypothetical protein